MAISVISRKTHKYTNTKDKEDENEDLKDKKDSNPDYPIEFDFDKHFGGFRETLTDMEYR